MKKDIKALIKRLTLLVRFKALGKGWWIAINGDGHIYTSKIRPCFWPSGVSESMDIWGVNGSPKLIMLLSNLDNLPLSSVCPSLASRDALFYTDGETVWLVEQ